VRVLKVLRDGPQHELVEVETALMLEGDFEESYTRGDNSRVITTDTMKNTVYALAKQHLEPEIEPFGVALGNHFLGRFPQVTRVTVQLIEHPWARLAVGGLPHPHSFHERGRSKPFAEIVCERGQASVESGVKDLLILKSSGSGFVGYVKDEFTTLPETRDRILATNLSARWHYSRAPRNYTASNRRALEVMLDTFATRYSPSVQTTLHEMAQAALESVPEMDRVQICMPNQHCLLVNLAPFQLENANEIFVPTDEPHGQIEAIVSRGEV
jgi:urate oxidase